MTEAEDLYSSRIVNCVFNVFNVCYSVFNTVTALALRKTSSLPKPLKTLLQSLAISDLGVGFVRIRRVLFHASFFSVTALRADRFLAIYLYLRYQELVTHKRVLAVVIN